MRFNEHLQAHLTPEWRTQYIEYEELRDIVVKMAEEAPKASEASGGTFRTYYDQCDFTFCNIWQPELHKIDNFFEEKLAEARRKFVTLKNELMDYQEQMERRTTMWQSLTALASSGDKNRKFKARRQEMRREKRQVKKLHDIKLGFSEFYLSLVLLQNYQSLNFTGFRKLFKKHDKLFGRSTGATWLTEHVKCAAFHNNNEVDQLIVKVETVYTKELEQGDRGRAMKRLRVPPLSEKQNPMTTFRVGFLFGILSVLVVILILLLIFLRPLPVVWEPAMRMFRATFFLAIFLLLIGANSYGWTTAGVNHVLIFEIDPRHHMTHQDYMEASGVLLILWALSVLYFLYSATLGTPSYLAPLVLWVLYAFFLFNPLRCFYHKARRWLLRILRRIFLAPYYSVSFADFWLADQLNSLAIVFVDVVFSLCFFACQVDWPHGLVLRATEADPLRANATLSASGSFVNAQGGICSRHLYGLIPVVRCLPAWFRLAQCIRRYYDMTERAPFPHLVNAGKYSSTFFVVIFSVIARVAFPDSRVCLALWIVSLIVATIYTYAWDILMDWGLFDVNEPHSTRRCTLRAMLRDELVYRHSIVYYMAILEDLLLRLAWVVDMVCSHFQLMNKEVLTCILCLGEVFRRFVWNFFRLENEHLNNCGQFRAVRDIFIAPISSTGHTSSSKRSDKLDSCSTMVQSEQRHPAIRKVDTPSRYRATGHMFGSRSSLDRHSYAQGHVDLEHCRSEEGLKTSLIFRDDEEEGNSHIDGAGGTSQSPVKFQIDLEEGPLSPPEVDGQPKQCWI